jgi:hypothetical protein
VVRSESPGTYRAAESGFGTPSPFPGRAERPKNLYTKSEKLSFRVTCAWSERVNLYDGQIMIKVQLKRDGTR